MALTKQQKTAQLQELKDKMQRAQSIVFAHYIGMTVSEVSLLRDQLRKGDAEMKVAKKTLMEIAAKETGLPDIDEEKLEGAVACIFSFADPLSGAQIAFKFAKDHKQVALIGGIYNGQLLTKEQAMELAKMPSRQQLLGMFMGMLQSPLRSFASMCNTPLVSFARALQELEKKGGLTPQAAAPAPAAEAAPEVVAEVAPAQVVEAAAPEAAAEPTSSESSESSESSVSPESSEATA